MERKNIQLKDTPESFFDQLKWTKFLGLFQGDPAAAVVRLSKRPDGFLLHIRQSDLESPGPRAVVAHLETERDELRDELVGDFTDRLSDGRLEATGMWRLERERNLIPVERWKRRCPCRKLDPGILMMQSAGHRSDVDPTSCLDCPSARRIFDERMRSSRPAQARYRAQIAEAAPKAIFSIINCAKPRNSLHFRTGAAAVGR